MKLHLPHLFGAFFLAVLTATSGYFFVREYDQSLRGVLPDSEAFTHWSKPDHVLPLSGVGQTNLLTGCIFALESWKTAFQSRNAVMTVARNCQAEADRVLTMHPSLSEAHYLRAYVAFLEGNPEQAQTELSLAQSGAPSDQWLAVRRVNLAQKLWPGEVKVGAYDLQNDLGLLIASNLGLDTATRLYIRYPQLREMIVNSTEQLDDRARVRFLNRLKRQVRG